VRDARPDEEPDEAQVAFFDQLAALTTGPDAGFAELAAGFAELVAGFAELAAGFAELTAGFAELTAGFAELTAGFAELTARYRADPRLTVPATVFNGVLQRVDEV
jgi:X-X-X-Leu-X-X-Gly heptad repeat protein